MPLLSGLLEKNRIWADAIKAQDVKFFSRLAQQQAPEYLWIGCADSRVPANQIVDLLPGELFVHRNVANVVVHTDFNCLSVLQYAVDVLKVKHVMVVGHFGCGGIRTAFYNEASGLINNWLRHVQDIRDKYTDALAALPSDQARINRLCELNVIEQVRHVCQTTILQEAWKRGQSIVVHGWIYDVADGLLRDLETCVASADTVDAVHKAAIERLLSHNNAS